MKLTVLGCSGGVGSGLHTTAMLVDQDIAIDAGTGLLTLSVEELARIDHVFITHSHLDHIAILPMLADTVGRMRSKPITIYTTLATLSILQNHIFNWMIWPDMSRVPDPSHPFMRFEVIVSGKTVDLGGRKITPVPANHVVPAVGFHLDSGQASLVFTGDTAACDELWVQVNNINNLRYLLIETAFSDQEADIATRAKHFCPKTLVEELHKLKKPAEILVTHMKPGESKHIMEQIAAMKFEQPISMLRQGQVIEF